VVGGWEEEELYIRVLQGEAQVYFDCQTHGLGIPKTTSPNKLVPSFFVYIYIYINYIYIERERERERERIHPLLLWPLLPPLFIWSKTDAPTGPGFMYIQIVGLYVINQTDIA